MLIAFTKGHGTENDFVLFEDPDNEFDLTPSQVRAVCDRRAGIGADGILRVVRAGQIAGRPEDPSLWFMDYRNADGSNAEMCGNGVRVFVRYLLDRGLVAGHSGSIPVGTRAGVKQTWILPDGRIRVEMGRSEVLGQDVTVRPAHGVDQPAYRVHVGNPHAVVFVPNVAALAELDLSRPPVWSPANAYPDGVNIEFVHRISDNRIAMRVFERGSGETRSCGTGTCAAVAATVAATTAANPAAGSGTTTQIRPVAYAVEVPGGKVEVELTADETYLSGPAVLVARGEFCLGADAVRVQST